MSGESEILNEGRVEVEVKLLNGKTERVTVKKVGYRHMSDLGMAGSDPGKTALLYIEDQKDLDWIDSLEPESVADLIDEGDKVNLPLLKRWFDRQERVGDLVSAKAKQKALEGVSPA